MYALAAMILEADMYPGEYFSVKNERGSTQKAELHVKEAQTCKTLEDLMYVTLLRGDYEKMEGLNTFESLVPKINFRKHDKKNLR